MVVDPNRRRCASLRHNALTAELLKAPVLHADETEKSSLRADGEFLTEWLELLTRWGEIEPYKQDTAKVNMLRELLGTE